MLERTGDDRYRNSALAARYLDRGRPSYVGGFAELSGTALFPAWTRLTEGLRSGEPQVEQPKDGDFFARTYQDPGRVRRFLSSMDAVNGRLAEELARCVDWSRYGTLADLGGARGNLAAVLVRAHPHLSATTFDLPQLRESFDEHINALGLTAKVRFQDGDFFHDPLPKADVLIYGQVLHDWDPDRRRALIERAYEALDPGGTLLVYDRMYHACRPDVTARLYSLNRLVCSTGGGSEYPAAECLEWLREAGFSEVGTRPLLTSHTLAIGRR
jgi:8-O-methyltransferase